MTLRFRNAQDADLDAILLLVREAIDRMEQHGIFQWDDLYPTCEDFKRDIEQNHLFTGLMDGEIAVIYTLNQESDDEYRNGRWTCGSYRVLHRLCVHPHFQNQGIAWQTLFHIEEEQKAANIGSIRLDAFQQNPYALKLYQSLGYAIVGQVEYRKGAFYLFEKRL